MAILKVQTTQETELEVTYPMYFQNHDSSEMVKMNTEDDGIEITIDTIKKTVFTASQCYSVYKPSTEEEFIKIFQKTKSNINSLLIMASDVNSLPQPELKEVNDTITPSIEEEMPNGFDSWQEAHYDISAAITEALMSEYSNDEHSNEAIKTRGERGSGGIYDFARSLTNKFETDNKGIVWGEEKEYYDTMEEFIKEEIFSNK